MEKIHSEYCSVAIRGSPLTLNKNLDFADYVTAEIAVVDVSGAIVHCNQKWHSTARNGGLLVKQSGWNYISECEAAIQRGCDVTEILAGLRAVLQGELSSFIATYANPGRRHKERAARDVNCNAQFRCKEQIVRCRLATAISAAPRWCAPPVHMIKLTEARQTTPYRWVHPDDDR
jgi:hypothetical protein